MQPSFVYETIDALDLPPRGAGEMAGNLRQCYETLIEKSRVGEDQLQLLEAWLADLRMISRDSGAIALVSSFHWNAFPARVRIRMAGFDCCV